MTTIAEADFVVSATDVAVIVAEDGLGTVAGAAYRPADVIVPQEFPTQPVPLTFQVTPVLLVPVTLAENCCCPPTASVARVGVTVTETLTTAWTVTVAVPTTAESASEVALTVTVLGLGTVAGAVYRPVPVIWPQTMPLHPAPVTLQITTLLLVPVTAAENCTCAPGLTCAGLGETVTEITDAAVS
jgi:hypothetical protein